MRPDTSTTQGQMDWQGQRPGGWREVQHNCVGPQADPQAADQGL